MTDFAKLAEHKSNQRDIMRANKLRKEMPLAECLLWNALRTNGKNKGMRFRRQHTISPYVVDFACLKVKLIIEIDGESHNNRHLYDKSRDDYLKDLGYEVMRFTNEDVYQNLEGVVLMILNYVMERIEAVVVPHP